MPTEELTGRTLGDFVVRHRIGEGGFGAVYRAEQPLLGREAVIKVLHNRHRSSKTVIQRFLREARLASKLDHPYAAHIYAFGVESDDLMWIAMEYVKGMSLHELLRSKGPMPLEELVPLLDRICEVLQAAHDLGIVHRDIKPPNVMVVQRSGHVFPKLLDFGVAKLAGDDPLAAPEQTPSGSTPAPTPTPSPNRPLGSPGLPAAVLRPMAAPDGADNTVSFVGQVGGAVAGAIQARRNRDTGGLGPTMEAGADSARHALGSPATSNTDQEPVLTEAGAAVGSPPYMAPEQWEDSAAATARTDLYALGVMTYEALVGRRPFIGTSVMAMALAHSLQPVPPLGGTFPVALDAVMAKALAKKAADRYPSAMAFAQAFRAAAGFGTDTLPALDEDLRLSVEASFPQPIAEAVAGFHSSRNAHQARDALRDIASTSIRYIALIALASQAQIRLTDAGSAAASSELIRELRRRLLRDEEWLSLARKLVAPFAQQPKTHPMPELVSVLQLEGESDHFTSLVQPRSGDPDALQTIRELLPQITRMLRALTFLADYPLVVAADGHAESWMGVRRPRRVALEIHGRAIEAGQPVLVDAGSRPVVVLWPVIQTSSPMPGAATELFLLDGRGRRGARLVAMPLTLERQDERVWDWLAERFSGHDRDTPVSSGSDDARPYRGLSSFTSQDADAFVGREREVDAAVNRLRTSSLVAIVGPSGAGKSSFVHAGIVPSLPDGWTTISVRPGATPLNALELRLRRAGFVVTGLGAMLGRDPSALGEIFRARDETTVLVIDQFEELFTLGASADEQRAYVRALLSAAQSPEDKVRVVLTLRDDFLARATQVPELRERLPTSLFLLGTPARTDLVRILTEPLARHGFDFDDPALAQRMVDEVADTPGALALLSFTAQKVWELRDRHFRQLTRKAYDALGGVAGALAQHAETTLAALSSSEQRLARTALGHLVTAEGTRAILSRRELGQLLRDDHAAAVIEKLVTARLLTATESEGGDESIEIVHEALIVAWPRLAQWRREDAEGARLRDQVRAAARQWIERDRPRGLLWRDDALAELQVWRTRHPQPLTDADEAFVAASLAEATRGRRLRRGMIGVVLGLMSIAVAVLVWARSNAQASAARDRARSQHELVESCRQAVLTGHAADARLLLQEARALGAEETPLVHFLEAAANEPLATTVTTLKGHTKEIRKAWFDGSGKRLLTASSDGTARLWDAATGAQLAVLEGCKTSLSGARFDPTSTWIDTECDDGIVRLYTGDGKFARQVTAGDKQWASLFARFSPDGTRLATTLSGNLRIWDSRTGKLMWSSPPDDPQAHPVFGSDRSIIASIANGQGWTVSLWALDTGALIRKIPFTPGPKAEFVQESLLELQPGSMTMVIVAAGGRIAEIWDGQTGALLHSLVGHSAPIDRLTISRDGRYVATAARDLTLRLWRMADGELVSSLSTGLGAATDITFSPDGRLLAAATADGTSLIWDVATGTKLFTLQDHSGNVWSAAFAPDSTRIVTGGADTKVVVSELAAKATMTVLPQDDAVSSIELRNHALLAIDGSARLWDTRTHQLLARSTTNDVVMGVFVGDDRTILAHASGQLTAWSRGAHDPGGTTTTLAELGGAVSFLAFDHDRRVVAVTGQAVTVVDITTGEIRLRGKISAPIFTLQFGGDGTLYVGDVDGHVTSWRRDGSPGVTTIQHPYGGIEAIVTSQTNVFTAGGDGTIRIWSLDGKPLRVLAGHAADVIGIKLDHSGHRLISMSVDGTARLWNVDTGQELARMVHSSWVSDAVFTPGDRFVFTASHDGAVRLWDTATGLELERFDTQGVASIGALLALDPEQHLLITGGNHKVVLHAINGLDWN